MTTTKLTDVIVPERFNPYYQEQSTKVNAFFRSGIVAGVTDLSFGGKGGSAINMPFWKALNGRAQLLDDTQDLTISKIQTGQDLAVEHARALVYGGTDMAAHLAGDDPMDAIAAGVAENWSQEFNLMILATLRGAMGALQNAGVNTLNIAGESGDAGLLNGSTFVDAGQTLGDAKGKIAAVAMHSAVESALRKQGLVLDLIDPADGKSIISTFQGKRVIVDDDLAPDSGEVYPTFLFGQGAVGFAEGTAKVPSETGREPLLGGGQEYLVTRRHFVLHPRGIKWIGTAAAQSPTDAELQDADNWSRVWDPKNIRIVRVLHRIA